MKVSTSLLQLVSVDKAILLFLSLPSQIPYTKHARRRIDIHTAAASSAQLHDMVCK